MIFRTIPHCKTIIFSFLIFEGGGRGGRGGFKHISPAIHPLRESRRSGLKHSLTLAYRLELTSVTFEISEVKRCKCLLFRSFDCKLYFVIHPTGTRFHGDIYSVGHYRPVTKDVVLSLNDVS
uniref:Uncharacterized protein n=1 Tax=Ixodes ricinus TaxID=34613 RepID=A0A6B0UP24_IXORI